MQILYIFQYFATPNGSCVTRAYEFCRWWAARGHKVTMLTTTARLTPEDLKNATGKFLKKINFEGINVLAFGIPYTQKMSKARRYLAWIGFSFVSVMAALLMKNVDVIYARSTPLVIGIPAIAAKRLRKIPFVFDVTDQWPEIPIELGIISNRILIKLLLWLEKTIYRHSDSIIACSPGMADGVREVMNKEKLREKPITVVPNLSETSFFRPDIDGSKVRKERGWDGKLVFLHAGTMGKVGGLGFVIDAAEKLKEHNDIMFVLIGDGSEKLFLESKVEKLCLANVQILPRVPKQQLREILAAVDVVLVIIGNYPILEHNSAAKFFDGLSAGKPVLLNYSGWQREILEDNAAGFGCDLCNLDEFVEKVLYFNTNRRALVKMGQNARLIAEKKFDKDILASQALKVLELVVER